MRTSFGYRSKPAERNQAIIRTLKILRPRAMEASAMKLTVEADGHPIGKVGNGKEISAEIDVLRPCGATAG